MEYQWRGRKEDLAQDLTDEMMREIWGCSRKGEFWYPGKFGDTAGRTPFTQEEIRRITDLSYSRDQYTDIEEDEFWADEITPITCSVSVNKFYSLVKYKEKIDFFEKEEDWKESVERKWPIKNAIKASSLVKFIKGISEDEELFNLIRNTGILLAGVCVVGDINLYNFTLPFPLRFRACRLEGRLLLRLARTGTLDMHGTFMRRLEGRGLKVAGDFYCTGAAVEDGIFADGVEVAGRMDLDRAFLSAGRPDQCLDERIISGKSLHALALNLEGAKIVQDLSMKGLRANGCLVIDNASIGSRFLISEALVDARVRMDEEYQGEASLQGETLYKKRPPHARAYFAEWSERTSDGFRGYALKAMALTVKGSVDCSGAIFFGEVRMLSLKGGGGVHFNDVKVFGSKARALLLDYAQVSEDLYLTGLQCWGVVRIRKALIGGDLTCSDTTRKWQKMRDHYSGEPIPEKAEEKSIRIRFSIKAGRRRIGTDEAERAYGRVSGIALSLTGTQISGALNIYGTKDQMAQFDGCVNLNNVSVGRHLRMHCCQIRRARREPTRHDANRNDPSENFGLKDVVDAPFLKVGADLELEGVQIIGSFEASDADIKGNVLLLSRNRQEVKSAEPDRDGWYREEGSEKTGGWGRNYSGIFSPRFRVVRRKKKDECKSRELGGTHDKDKEPLKLYIHGRYGRPALNFTRAKIGGEFRLDSHQRESSYQADAFCIIGAVLLTNAQIGGRITLGAGQCFATRYRYFIPAEDGIAFSARAATVKRGVLVDWGFRARGELRFIEAKIHDDVVFRNATISMEPHRVGQHPYAIRFERSVIDGNFAIGDRRFGYDEDQIPQSLKDGQPSGGDAGESEKYGNSQEKHFFGSRTETGDQSYESSDFRFKCRGGIVFEGAHIDGTLSISSAVITSLGGEIKPKLINGKNGRFERDIKGKLKTRIAAEENKPLQEQADQHNVPDHMKIGAIEAGLIKISKDLAFGDEEHPVFVDGQINLEGAQVDGTAKIAHLMVSGPKLLEPLKGRENALLGSSLKIGLDLFVNDCRFVGGAIFQQCAIGGSCQIENSAFIAYDLLSDGTWRPGEHRFDLLQVDPGEVGLSMLHSEVGRSLKIQDTVGVYGVAQLNGVQVKNDFEFWLRCLRPLHESNWRLLRDDLRMLCGQFDVVSKELNCMIESVSRNVEEPSLFTAIRAHIGGTFFYGLRSDEDGIEAAPKSPAEQRRYDREVERYARKHKIGRSDEKLTDYWKYCKAVEEPREANHRGYLDLTDMFVHALHDAESAWPDHGNLVLYGFYYDRIAQFRKEVPVSARLRLKRWLSSARASSRGNDPQGGETEKQDALYDQLYSAYMRMGRIDDAERTDREKRSARFWSMPIIFGSRSLSYIYRRMSGRFEREFKAFCRKRMISSMQHRWARKLINWLASVCSRICGTLIIILLFPFFLPLILSKVILLAIYPIYGMLMLYGYQRWRVPFALLALILVSFVYVDMARPRLLGAEKAKEYKDSFVKEYLAPSLDDNDDVVDKKEYQIRSFLKELNDGDMYKSCIIPHPDEYQAKLFTFKAGDYSQTYLKFHEFLIKKGAIYRPDVHPNFFSIRFIIDGVIPFDLGVSRFWVLSYADECTKNKTPHFQVYKEWVSEKLAQIDKITIVKFTVARFQEGLAAVSDGMSPVWEAASDIFQPIISPLSWIWNKLVSGLSWLWQNLSPNALQSFAMLAGYALFAIILATVTGFIRPRADPPKVPLRIGSQD